MLDKIFKSLCITHPKTGQTDVMLSLVVFVVVVCAFKFLFDGAEFHIAGHSFAFGHTDSFSYGSLLAPILGAHGYTATRPDPLSTQLIGTGGGAINDPDEEG